MITLLRVLLGTAVYALIVVLAAPFPTAAGLMLTFPALNGLAFIFAERARVPGMARSMLWMPVLNGILCWGYVLTFLASARPGSAVVLAWGLTAVVVALWAVIASRPKVLQGISPQRQLTFALSVTALGAVGVAAAMVLQGRTPAPAAEVWSDIVWWNFAGEAVARNWVKILLFAMCLTAFLILTRMLPLPDSVRGILAGLPLVPFVSLLSIAGDGAIDLSTRLEILAWMAISIPFAPAIPVWFIYGFFGFLVRTPRSDGEVFKDLPALLAAWAMCGTAIAGVAYVLRSP